MPARSLRSTNHAAGRESSCPDCLRNVNAASFEGFSPVQWGNANCMPRAFSTSPERAHRRAPHAPAHSATPAAVLAWRRRRRFVDRAVIATALMTSLMLSAAPPGPHLRALAPDALDGPDASQDAAIAQLLGERTAALVHVTPDTLDDADRRPSVATATRARVRPVRLPRHRLLRRSRRAFSRISSRTIPAARAATILRAATTTPAPIIICGRIRG